MKLGWTDDMYRVHQVRAHKRILSGHMSQREIADAVGIGLETLRSYGRDPGTANHRAIPEDRLRRLHELTLDTLEATLGVYRAAA